MIKLSAGIICLALASNVMADFSHARIENAQALSSHDKGVAHRSPLASLAAFGDLSTQAFDTLPAKRQAAYAKQWNMSVADFKKYLFVKANTPVGNLYGGVKQDPNILLALHALHTHQKEAAYRYMEQAVKNEYALTGELLTAQNLFQRMVQRLHPNETPIHLAGERPASYISYGNPFAKMLGHLKVMTDGSTYVLLMSAQDHNTMLKGHVSKLIEKLLLMQGVRLDIYDISGSGDEDIISWAKAMGIDPALINGGLITLNQGGQFVKKLEQREHVSLGEGLLKEVDGHYHKILWGEV